MAFRRKFRGRPGRRSFKRSRGRVRNRRSKRSFRTISVSRGGIRL
nr:MAG: hypothetical protein [Microvirus sp.]